MRKPTPGHDILLGRVTGTNADVVHTRHGRAMHDYIAGATGTGKSKLLESMIRQHIRDHRRHRCGMLLIDPHGNLYDNIMRWCARLNLDRPIVPIDLRMDDWSVSYNPLRRRSKAAASVIVDSMVLAMVHAWGASNTDQTPRLSRWATNTFHALYDNALTLADALAVLDDPALRAVMTAQVRDEIAKRDWEKADDFSPKDLEVQLESTINRLQRFLRCELIRVMVGQTGQSLDLGKALDDGSIILVSLAQAKGKVSRENADLVGSLLMSDLWTAAQERGKRDGIKPFYVFLDEFQRFVGPSVVDLLDEARGFGLHMTLSQQFPQQLSDRGPEGVKLLHSVMENAASKIVFRLSDEDNLRPLAQALFRGVLNPDEVKHTLYSTKVMQYVEEMQTSHTIGSQHAVGHSAGENVGRVWVEANGAIQTEAEGESFADPGKSDVLTGSSEPKKQLSRSKSKGSTTTLSDGGSQATTTARNEVHADSESTSYFKVLVPKLGKEASSVQFRSIEEQIHRAMAALHDQQERHFTVRLVGMTVPLAVCTPEVKDVALPAHLLASYREFLLRRLPYAKPFAVAMEQIRAREATRLARITSVCAAQNEPWPMVEGTVVPPEPYGTCDTIQP